MSTKNDQDIGTKLAGFIPRMGNSPKFWTWTLLLLTKQFPVSPSDPLPNKAMSSDRDSSSLQSRCGTRVELIRLQNPPHPSLHISNVHCGNPWPDSAIQFWYILQFNGPYVCLFHSIDLTTCTADSAMSTWVTRTSCIIGTTVHFYVLSVSADEHRLFLLIQSMPPNLNQLSSST